MTTGRLSNGTRVIDHPDIRPLVAEGWSLLADAYIETIQRALDSCQMEGKPGQAFVANYWIKQGRANVKGASLPSATAATFNATMTTANTLAEKCLAFSIDFDSDLTVAGVAATTLHVVVSASGFIDLKGPLPLNPGVFTLTPIKCGRFDNVTHTAGTQGLWQLSFVVGDQIDLGEARTNNITTAELDYTPGMTSCSFTLVDTCTTNQPEYCGPAALVRGLPRLARADSLPPRRNGLFSVSTWDGGIGFGATFAKKSYPEFVHQR